jgi:hypothetical protein
LQAVETAPEVISMSNYRNQRRPQRRREPKNLPLLHASAVIRDLQRLTKAWRANGYLASNPPIIDKILKIAAAHSQPLELENAVSRIRQGRNVLSFPSGEPYDGPIWFSRWAASQLPEASDEQIVRAMSEPDRSYSMDEIAEILGVTLDMRQRLKLWSFGACDATREERLARAKDDKRRKDRERARQRRRAAGKPSRAQFEATSRSRTKPWIAAGFQCRRTWERHGQPVASVVASLSRPDNKKAVASV